MMPYFSRDSYKHTEYPYKTQIYFSLSSKQNKSESLHNALWKMHKLKPFFLLKCLFFNLLSPRHAGLTQTLTWTLKWETFKRFLLASCAITVAWTSCICPKPKTESAVQVNRIIYNISTLRVLGYPFKPVQKQRRAFKDARKRHGLLAKLEHPNNTAQQ